MDVDLISTDRKIGILGGSFNPVHYGHLLMAETALDQFGLDEIIWVPTYRPPHKSRYLLPFKHRWAMVQGAIADHPRFTATDLERHQPIPSFAAETFAQLQTLYPQTIWHWIIGIDAFQHLATWRNCETLVTQCIWLVAPRQHRPVESIAAQVATELAKPHLCLHWHPLPMPEIGISSSLIRRYCQQGRSLWYLVPNAVREYIDIHQLYQGERGEDGEEE